MECHARALALALVRRRHTDLHGGRDVGQGEALQVRQQARGDHRRLGGAGGSGRNWKRQGVKTSRWANGRPGLIHLLNEAAFAVLRQLAAGLLILTIKHFHVYFETFIL